MRLILNPTSSTNQLSGGADRFVFDQRGGSIGRAQDNDCVLPDPNLYLSRKHAVISYKGGAYNLTDTSENGVFVNESDQSVGKHNTVVLHDGDCLTLGDYEFRVCIDPSDHASSAGQRETGHESAGSRPASSPWSGAESENASPNILDGSVDAKIPGVSGRNFGGSARKPVGQPAAEPNHSPAEQDYFEPLPMDKENRFDNWDETGLTSVPDDESRAPDWDQTGISSGPNTSPEPGSAGGEDATGSESTSAGSAYRPTPDSPELSTGGVDALQAFLQGAGLNNTTQLSPEAAAALMKLLGTLYRDIVHGLMDVLRARSDLKNEFRMRQTQIHTKENNPLKFTGPVDDALEHLVLKRSRGFLAPEAAFQEAFQDIKDHQVAMVVGMRAAFESLLRRFDPELMESRVIKRKSSANILPVTRKAGCWERYEEWYAEISAAAEDDFQDLFGNEFTRAYEEQVARLSLLRKKPRR